MDEIWKDIEGYEGKYAVSNKGRVKSLERVDSLGRRVNEKILRPCKSGNGYLLIWLCKGGSRKLHYIHRLVLSTFNPCENSHELQVNHIDENTENNNLTNLEWVTCKENINHGTHNDRVAEKKSIPIAQLALDGKYIKSWKSSMDAQREGGFNRGHIIQCCKGRLKTHGGYKWQYLHDYISQIDPRIKKVILFNKEYEF